MSNSSNFIHLISILLVILNFSSLFPLICLARDTLIGALGWVNIVGVKGNSQLAAAVNWGSPYIDNQVSVLSDFTPTYKITV